MIWLWVGLVNGVVDDQHPVEIQNVQKEKEVQGKAVVKYYNGVIPYRGMAIFGFNEEQLLETFDNGIDTSATGFWDQIIDGNGDGATWDTASAVYWPYEYTFPNPPGAVYDDDDAGSGAPPGYDALLSKAIDFTSFNDGDTVILRFYSLFNQCCSDSAIVAIQPNIFGSWDYWDTVLVLYSDRLGGMEYIDLSDYALADSIRILFSYISHSWGWGWGIDDIALGRFVSEILFSEDFESGTMPAGWTVVDSNNDGASWEVGTTSDLSSYTPPNYGTAYAYYSDDDAGSGAPPGSEWLISPSIYVGGYTKVGLAYDMGFNIIDPVNERFEVYIRTFDGTSWSDWNEVAAYYGQDTALHEVLDISSLMPAESLQIAFVYKDLDGGWYWAVGVDNVTVFEVVPPTLDAGIVKVEPTGPIVPSTFDPQVIVGNFGITQIPQYEVYYLITNQIGDTLLYDSVSIINQYFGALDTLTFGTVNANIDDTVSINVWLSISDDNAANNSAQYSAVVVPDNDIAVLGVQPYLPVGDPLFEYPIYVTIANTGYYSASNVQVKVEVLDSSSNVIFEDTLEVTEINPTESATLETAPFQPPYELADYTISAYLLSTDDRTSNDTSYADFSTMIGGPGTWVYYYQFPDLGTYSLAGITAGEDLGIFYLVSMNDRAIYKLTINSLEQLFVTHHFGGAYADIPWGIAFDPTDSTLYVTHIGMNTSSAVDYLYAAKYDLAGNLLDTVDLLALTGQGYIAGMTYSPYGYFWAVGVADPGWNTMATIYKLDLHNKTVLAALPNPHPSTYRGVDFYAHGANLVFLGGWNQDSIHVYDTTLSTLYGGFPAPSMADLAIYEDVNHYQGLIFVTHSTSSNYISVVSYGSNWPVETREDTEVRKLAFAPNAVNNGYLSARLSLPFAANVTIDLYDISGKHIATVYNGKMPAGVHQIQWDAKTSGVYIWYVRVNDQTFTNKAVLIK